MSNSFDVTHWTRPIRSIAFKVLSLDLDEGRRKNLLAWSIRCLHPTDEDDLSSRKDETETNEEFIELRQRRLVFIFIDYVDPICRFFSNIFLKEFVRFYCQIVSTDGAQQNLLIVCFTTWRMCPTCLEEVSLRSLKSCSMSICFVFILSWPVTRENLFAKNIDKEDERVEKQKMIISRKCSTFSQMQSKMKTRVVRCFFFFIFSSFRFSSRAMASVHKWFVLNVVEIFVLLVENDYLEGEGEGKHHHWHNTLVDGCTGL